MALAAQALSPVPKATWLGLSSNDWGDSGNWIFGPVPNNANAIAEFSSKNPFTNGVNLGGGPFLIRELNIWNSGGMGWTFEYGTLVFSPGGRIIVENRADIFPILDNGSFELSGPVTITVMAGGRFLSNPAGIITGPGSLTIEGAGETVFKGLNTYTGGTVINGGVLQIGDGWTMGQLTPGPVVNNGMLRFFRSDDITSGETISGTGAVEKRGAGRLTLTGASSYSGTTSVQEGILQLGLGGTTGSIGGGPINLSATTGLVVNRSDSLAMPNVITGTGTLSHTGSGTTTLSGNSAAFGGTTNINAGSLLLTGSLGGTVNVNAGGLLGGTGTVGSAGRTTTVNSGGRLAPGLSPGTLTVAGNLALAAGSVSNFELRTPGLVGGAGPTANDLVVVQGDLSIANGSILNLSASVSGSYRLFNVDGTITPGGGANLGFTTINTTGGAFTASVFQTAGSPNQVNALLVSAGQAVQAFDGSDFTGAVAGGQGGLGTWASASTNWTENPNGVINDRWLGQVGIFGGAAGGMVTASGALDFQGLQFTVNGYSVAGGALNAVGNGVAGGNAQAAFLNIDAGVTTTISSTITSTAGVGLDKLGQGTLILAGANSYAGMTDIQAGALEIRNGTALGAADGLQATGTRVRTGAALALAGGIAVGNEALSLSGNGIANGGALRSLSGSNAWAGPITLEVASRINADAGTLTLGGPIGGTGRNLAVGGAGDITINGAITTGAGALTHDGSGTLTLNGANSFTGLTGNVSGTLVNNGRLAGTLSNDAIIRNAGTVLGGLVNRALASNLPTGSIQQGVSNSGVFSNAGTVQGGLVNTAQASNLATGSIQQGVDNSGTLYNSGTILGGLANAAQPATLATGEPQTAVSNSGTLFNGGAILGGLVNTEKASNLPTGSIQKGVRNSGFFESSGAIDGGLTNESLVQISGQLAGDVVNGSNGIIWVAGPLRGAMPAFDNAGYVALQGGDLTGVRAFSNAGLLTASDGMARTLGADTFTNQSTGVVSQANGRLSDVLTITGNYIGAPGSRVQQDIDLALPGNAGAGDRIMVGGSASGATTFVFNPTSSRRAVFRAPIPVFTTSGDNTLVANEGKLGQLGSGFFDYFLRRSASRSGFEIASFYNSSPAASVAGSLAGLTSSQQSSFQAPYAAIVSRSSDCRPDQPIGGPFIRMRAADSTMTERSAGDIVGGGIPFTGSTRSSASLRGFQSGFDLGLCNLRNSGWSMHAGLVAGVSEISATGLSRAPTPVPGLDAAARARAIANVPFVGAYSFVSNGAFTAEFDVRRDFYDVQLSSADTSTGFAFIGPHQRVKGDGWSFNGSLAYRIAIGERLHLEPMVGLSRARTSFGSIPFATGGSDAMRIDPLESLMARVGLSAGASFQVSNHLVAAPFVSGSLWRAFSKPLRTEAQVGSSAQTFVAETEQQATFGQIGAGLQLNSSDAALASYIRGDLRFGDRIAGRSLNAGLKLSF